MPPAPDAAPAPDDWGALPALADLPDDLRQALAAGVQPFSAPAASLLFDVGTPCQVLPLLLQGELRVSQRSASGRELVLYHVHPGELCIVTLGCLLGGTAYPATGTARSPIRALGLPRELFMTLLHRHAPFREWVFRLFTERIAGLMHLVQEVAFRRLDQRLAGWLAAHAPLAEVSHQTIADDLGSVREIVSRLLKTFEEQGWVRLGRARIEILDPAALRELARAG